MKKITFLLLFFFLSSDVFALEPSDVLKAKVAASDLIVIGKPIEAKELEKDSMGVKKVITIAVKKVIKGFLVSNEVTFESERNLGSDGRSTCLPFWGGQATRVLFLTKTSSGTYILFRCDPSYKYGNQAQADVIISNCGQVSVGFDAQEFIDYTEKSRAAAMNHQPPLSMPAEEFLIDLSDYIDMLESAKRAW